MPTRGERREHQFGESAFYSTGRFIAIRFIMCVLWVMVFVGVLQVFALWVVGAPVGRARADAQRARLPGQGWLPTGTTR
tara:strand:- start:403 stop:639 length:237 start_codon:yes stop_codon:yes gene_type:complete